MRFPRSLSLFPILWFPAVATLLAGLARAWRTGQADPWDWALPAAPLLAAAGLLLAARRGWAAVGWAAMGTVGTVLLFCAVAAGRAPDGWAAAGLVLTALLAAAGGALMGGKRMGLGLALLGAAGLLLWRGPARPILSRPDRPALAVISGLPLFWREDGGRADAPIVAVMRTRFDMRPLDDPRDLEASGARLLLLAQPRAMPPAALVALDRWVRDGGRVLVLADPLLRWPSALPLGDRRRAPPVSLLGPLLTHWGVEPLAPVEGEIRHFLPDGRLVTLWGAGPLWHGGREDVLPLRLKIGRGEALLLGDADPIDDRLWLADPARPLDPRAWSADTPELLAQWLGADLPGGRRWLRGAPDVRAGLRAAMLAGTGWAMLGLILPRRKKQRKGAGTKHEDLLAGGLEND